MLSDSETGPRARRPDPRADLAQRARRAGSGCRRRASRASPSRSSTAGCWSSSTTGPTGRSAGPSARSTSRRDWRTSRASRSRGRPSTWSRRTCAPGSSPTRSTPWSAATRTASPPRSPARSAALGVDRIAGVGVSLGGAVRDGRVEFAPFLDWTDVPFARLVEAELGVPASIENDLVALAEAERWFGRGARHPRLRRHHHRRRHRLRARRERPGRALARGGRRPRRPHPARQHRARLPRGSPRVRGGHADVGIDRGPGLGGPAAPGRLRRGAAPRGRRRPGGDDRRRRGRGRRSGVSSRWPPT